MLREYGRSSAVFKESSGIKSVLSSLCFNSFIDHTIHVEGINFIDKLDIDNANKLGYKIKLLGITEIINKNIFERVHPCLVDINSFIGNVNGVFNASITSVCFGDDSISYNSSV